MAKKKEDIASKGAIKNIQEQNELFKKVMGKLSPSDNSHDLDMMNRAIDDVIKTEIEDISKFTGDDITTFLYKTVSQDERISSNVIKNIDDIFNTGKNESIANMMFSKQANSNILLEDLDVVSSYVYQLKEAINATRDAIVTSDDIGVQISRSLTFRNSSSDTSSEANTINMIEKMERELKLHHRAKNHIIPKTLSFGKYYVYTVPYSKLIKDYKDKNASGYKGVTESTLTFETSDIKEMSQILENARESDVKKSMESFNGNISVISQPTSIIPGLVSEEEIAAMESGNYMTGIDSVITDAVKKNNTGAKSSESVIDSNKGENFDEVSGCYIKLIDPRRLVKVKVLDKVIGYYYTVDTGGSHKTSFTSSFKMNLNNANNTDVESSFVHMISDKIVKSIDKKYLQNNAKFKDLIVNALLFEDMYKKKTRFQFIPVDYITEFSIDEDIEGDGQSMLINSLFYAKMYLYILIFKVLTILTKSNDQKVHYVKSSGIDKNVANSTQTVARSLKENQMNFTDLMSYNNSMNKIGKSKDVFVPTGTQNERGIETDILSGQDVQLNTELMESLITNAINSTGVPSVIMSYINEADYSRTLIMANAKFIGRVINYQIDFNRSMTEMYKKLMRYSLNLDDVTIESFEYTLSPPKSLNNVNMSDVISNAEQSANFIVKALIGEARNPTEDDNILKDILFKKVSKELLPMIQWGKMDELFAISREELAVFKAEAKLKPQEN